VGIIEHTNFISPKHYENSHLIYLTKYSSSDDPVFLKLDEDILKDFLDHLKRIFPKFSKSDIEKYWVFKDRFSQPVFIQNYSKVMPATSTPVRNLYMLNTAQIYPQSRSINSGIEMAHNLVKEILAKHDN
jgi:protoporphyrinogen oxidase